MELITCKKCERVFETNRAFTIHRSCCAKVPSADKLRRMYSDGQALSKFVKKHNLRIASSTLKTYLAAAGFQNLPNRTVARGSYRKRRAYKGRCAYCEIKADTFRPGSLCPECWRIGWRGLVETAVLLKGRVVAREFVNIITGRKYSY